MNHRAGEQLERAAHLGVGEAAEATHQQERVDADRFKPLHLSLHLLG